jgi:glycosyltransferase involved in cell wall biosynthesis
MESLCISLFPCLSMGGGETFIINTLSSMRQNGCRAAFACPTRQLPDRQALSARLDTPWLYVAELLNSAPPEVITWRKLLLRMAKVDLCHIHQYASNDSVFDLLANTSPDQHVLFTSHGHEPIIEEFRAYYQPSPNHCRVEVSKFSLRRNELGGVRAITPLTGIWSRQIVNKTTRPTRRDGLSVCGVGRRLPHKGFEHTIDGLGPKDHLVIYGPPPTMPAYTKYLNSRPHAMRTTYREGLDDAALAAALREHDVLVASSTVRLYNGQMIAQAELLGLVLIEAIAAGTLAISSDLPSFREVMETLGLADWIYPEGESAALGSLLDRLRSLTPTERQILVQGAQERLQREFLWDDYWPRILRDAFAA